MADLSAKNFGIAGIFLILLLLASLMLVGFMTYLAWHQENPWPSSTYGQMFAPPSPRSPVTPKMLTPPTPRKLECRPAVLFGEPPLPPANRQAVKL